MNYYYDVVLNFLEDNYQFYEALENDSFDYIKKIPLIQVTNITFKKIYSNVIKVDKEFLDSIYKETVTEDSTLDYCVLIADKNNVLALEFNSDGIEIDRSNLSLIDELNILDIIYTVELSYLDIEIVKPLEIKKLLRKEEAIKRLINVEISKLYQDKNYSKLQFLYLEWFGKMEKNYEVIYKKMLDRLNKEIGEKEEKIYNIIKLSYNNV